MAEDDVTRIDPEFSRKVPFEDLLNEKETLELAPDAREAARLAERYSVLSVQNMKAFLKFAVQGGHKLHIKGTIIADVAQKCAVSLEPVTQHIHEEFEAFFINNDQAVSFVQAKHQRQREIEDPEIPFLDEKDDPEQVIDGKADLGELVAQHLSLMIEPYPRKEGVALEDDSAGKEAEDPSVHRRNPFEALKDWK